MSLLDMIQITAFSRKSGCLRVSGPRGDGAIFLRDGRVLFAYSWSTLGPLRELTASSNPISSDELRARIESSLRDLSSLRVGQFEFLLMEEFGPHVEEINLERLPLGLGLEPQELLLGIAVDLDNERKEASDLVELAFQGQVEDAPELAEDVEEEIRVLEAPAVPDSELGTSVSHGAPAPTAEGGGHTEPQYSVVFVDDEAPVRDVVGRDLEARGWQIFVASSPSDGIELVRACRLREEHVLLVADLKMPTTSGRSFYGGFELIRRVRQLVDTPSVLLMVESLSERARTTARKLGVRWVVHKPTLTKTDAELYRADLVEFAATVHTQLGKLKEPQSAPSASAVSSETGSSLTAPSTDTVGATGDDTGLTPPGAEATGEFLAKMTKKLLSLPGSTDISRLVLRVSAKFFERGILFIVRDDCAQGVAGFGIGDGDIECTQKAQAIQVDVGSSLPFNEVIRLTATQRLSRNLDALEVGIFQHIGKGKATQAALIPVSFNRATLMILYGDNALTGEVLRELGGLELFLAQAGMALENKLLQSKLEGTEVRVEAGVG
jgi:CheY-like chemotaxis protein